MLFIIKKHSAVLPNHSVKDRHNERIIIKYLHKIANICLDSN